MASAETQFKPGVSGNPGGRPKTRPFADALRAELEAAGDDGEVLRLIAAKLIEDAKSGNLAAVKELADRLDGKPAQQIAMDARISGMTHEDWLEALEELA